MKARNWLKIVTLSALLGLLVWGCLPSVHPLYTEDDLVFREELLGTWEDDDNIWTFTKSDEKEYGLIHIEDADTAYMDAHLVKLGDYYFLDLLLSDPPIENSLGQMHIISVHTFSKVTFREEGKISIEMFNSDWIVDMIKEGRVRIRHEVREDDDLILLTASTEELQKFVIKYADEPKAFSELTELTKAS